MRFEQVRDAVPVAGVPHRAGWIVRGVDDQQARARG